MNGFIVLFEEKEGTSPLVRLLDNFERISVVHHDNGGGWEPFDQHNCGPMTEADLSTCFDVLYSGGPIDMERLNQVYTRTAPRGLASIGPDTAVGFKMRLCSPKRSWREARARGLLSRLSRNVFGPGKDRAFEAQLIEDLKRNNVVVFIAVRQDVFRWGLSKYHGDGTGKQGHIQFKLAQGEITRNEIPTININCDRLGRTVDLCEQLHAKKRQLMEDLKRAGVRTHALLYEDFLHDKPAYFRRMFDLLELDVSDTEIQQALEQGTFFEKVHSDKISDFVENHEEVLEKFGKRFVSWA